MRQFPLYIMAGNIHVPLTQVSALQNAISAPVSVSFKDVIEKLVRYIYIHTHTVSHIHLPRGIVQGNLYFLDLG